MKGEKNNNSKLNNKKVLEIKRHIRDKNFSYRELAIKYGVSKSCVAHINQGLKWKHIQLPKEEK